MVQETSLKNDSDKGDSQALLRSVSELRAQGKPPKAIARALGLRPADAAAMLRRVAAAEAPASTGERSLRCLVSPGWSAAVDAPADRGWPDRELATGKFGLVVVALVEPHRDPHKSSVSGFLLDVHCLGVKDAVGPRIMPKTMVAEFLGRLFGSWDQEPVEISLELARELVFGAAAYARDLGFSPHPDFDKVKGALGDPPQSYSIQFGYEGRPFYTQGPYDDPAQVLRTLERSVRGQDFGYLLGGE